MTVPVRSLRLQKRSARSLDTLSGASGEIFFDADQNTLRIYTANQADSIVLADREWVAENTFSGNYADLTNTPFIPTDVSELSDSGNTLFSGNYLDLVGAPDLDSLSVDISTIDSIGDVDTSTSPLVAGQLLEWDGTNWVNTTVTGFTDTNTTYSFGIATNVDGGVDLNLTDSDANVEPVNVVGLNGIDVVLNLSGNLEIQNNTVYTINELSNVNISNPSTGQAVIWDGTQWANGSAAAQGGVALSDLSVGPAASASSDGAISYDNTTGVFTYTPPDLAAYAALTAFSVSVGTAQSAGNLSYNSDTGVFTFNPANLSGYAQLADLSVTQNAASGSGSLSYSNSTGVFEYTPPDLSAAGGGEVIDDTTPQLGGNLDLNTFDIIGPGDINVSGSGTFTGPISASSFSSSATGAPSITSASTITLIAPDGIILDNDASGDITLEAGRSVTNNGDSIVTLSLPYGNSFEEAFKIVGLSRNLSFDISGGQFNNVPGITFTSPDIPLKINSNTGIELNSTKVYPLPTATISSNVLTLDASVSDNWDLQALSVPTANYTINITNWPAVQDTTCTIKYTINTNNFTPTTININGSSAQVLWEGGSAPTGTGFLNAYYLELLSAGGANPIILGSMKSYS